MSSALPTRISLAAEGGKKRIVAQHVVIVGVLVAKAQPDYILAHQLLYTVLGEALIAKVAEAVCKLSKVIRHQCNFTQKQ